jgi:hypothetical protein
MLEREQAQWMTNWTAANAPFEEDERERDPHYYRQTHAYAHVTSVAVDGPVVACQCRDGAVSIHDFRWGLPIGDATLQPTGVEERRFWQCAPPAPSRLF